jgi:hypothetical protein
MLCPVSLTRKISEVPAPQISRSCTELLGHVAGMSVELDCPSTDCIVREPLRPESCHQTSQSAKNQLLIVLGSEATLHLKTRALCNDSCPKWLEHFDLEWSPEIG